jgi:hypothetical protein
MPLRFTEEMHGYVTFGEVRCEEAYLRGRSADTALRVHLTIEVDDVPALATDPGRAAAAGGYVHCEALGGRLPVARGTFNLFAGGNGVGRRMLYRLHFSDGTGHPLTLSGVKRLEPGGPTRLWPETTTLYTRLLQGHCDPAGEGSAELVASGILRITPLGFLRQLTTFRTDDRSVREQLATITRFGRLFVAQIARLYRPARALGGGAP